MTKNQQSKSFYKSRLLYSYREWCGGKQLNGQLNQLVSVKTKARNAFCMVYFAIFDRLIARYVIQ